MISSARSGVFAGLVILVVGAGFIEARPAFAQQKKHGKPAESAKPKPLADTLQDAARTEYQAGKILFDDGDFATALQKFKSAYSKQADPRLLWNIAASEKNLRHYAKSAKLFRQYVAEGGDLLTADDRKEAENLLKVIDELTLPVTITVSEPGAEVYLDDELLGSSPFTGPLVLDIGQRRFRVQKEGFRTVQNTLQIGPNKEASFKLERQRAGLELTVPPTATVLLDGKPLGKGPRVLNDDLPIGGHAVRIDAPRMRPYQGEVVLEDGKTRTLNIDLEPDPEQFGEIRVAVGCRTPRLHTPEDGLTVFFDGSNESASALGIRKRVENDKEVPVYVPFTVTAGAHTVRIRIPGCEPLETSVQAGPASPAVISGMLPPDNEWVNGSPSGSPDGWRVSAGLTSANMRFTRFNQFFTSGGFLSDADVTLAMAGPSVSGGLQRRWFSLLADARYLSGSSQGTREGLTNDGVTATLGPASQEASFSLWELGVRAGPRVPIHSAALSGGIGMGVGALHATPATNGGEQSRGYLHPFVWVGLDAKPLCEFAGGFAFEYGYAGATQATADDGRGQSIKYDVSPRQETTLLFHVAYEPNIMCTRRRDGEYRLNVEGAPQAGAPPAPVAATSGAAIR